MARDDGFTLLEILIGLAISALVMVGLSSAMHSVNLSWNQSTVRGERQAMLASGLRIAQGDLAHVERVFDDPAKPARFLFLGDDREIIFPLVERDGHNDHGLFWVHLFLRKSRDGIEFVRARAPFEPGPQDVAGLQWRDEVVLVHGPFDISFSYLAGGDAQMWDTAWPLQNRLPRQVRIDIASASGSMPLKLPPAITALGIGAELRCVAEDKGLCTLGTGGKLEPSSGGKP